MITVRTLFHNQSLRGLSVLFFTTNCNWGTIGEARRAILSGLHIKAKDITIYQPHIRSHPDEPFRSSVRSIFDLEGKSGI
jgi:hypothetical protein